MKIRHFAAAVPRPPMCRLPWALSICLGALPGASPWAQSMTAAGGETREVLPAVEVRGNYNNAVGTSDAASQGSINARLLETRPAMRPGEVLEFVPGLIVTQHSGYGKANQYFLRGFNLDHGTDFATSIDGVPVNMPTHAHGHGYQLDTQQNDTGHQRYPDH